MRCAQHQDLQPLHELHGRRMLKYLGLSNNDPGDTLPMWHGVDKKKRALALLVSVLLASAMFFLTSWLLSDAPKTSFTKYVPVMFAALTLSLSTVIAERSLVRAPGKSEQDQLEQ